MKSTVSHHRCPVCGYVELSAAPRPKSGGGSYEICPSCGFQFGVDDDDRRVSFADHRERWKKGGMKWSSRGILPPKDWNPAAQLASLSAESS